MIKLFLKVTAFLIISFTAYKTYYAIYIEPEEDRQYVIDLKKAKEKNKAFKNFIFKDLAFEGTVISNEYDRLYNKYRAFHFNVIKLKIFTIDIPVNTKKKYKNIYDFTNKDESLIYLVQHGAIGSHIMEIREGDKIIKKKGNEFYIVFYKDNRYKPEIINILLEDIFWE
jgi:hypothetical protein